QVLDAEGNYHSYSKLVLATGSRPHIPDVEGIDLNGVFTFRNMRDSERLKARTVRSQSMVVVGGGLLGIEAARALLQSNTHITLVQQASHLMNNQLDETASLRLQSELEQLGIEVITGEGVRRIEGSDRVEAVVLRDNRRLSCDTVLLSAGIKPNMEIGRRAWLKVARGIKVDDQLRTSDGNIFAIGECAEHRGQVYGLVAPGLEQATIAADNIAGGDSRYLGSHSVAKLKVVDTPVFSMGDTDMDNGIRKRAIVFSDSENYRKLVFSQGKLVGAMAIGEWKETPRLQELITHQRQLKPWQKLRFRFSGFLWNPADAENPNLWPEQSIICNCNNVSRGTLSQALENGCCSVSELSAETTAATTCGSCKPLLQLMVGDQQPAAPEKGWSGLMATAILTPVLAAMMLFIPGLTLSDSVQGGQWLEQIWNDGLIKQITGFTLLGLTLIGLAMSLRKRMKRFQLGTFNHWRLAHVILGVLTLALLLAHTGLHTGNNLNQWLLYDYLALAALGALASAVIALQFKFSATTGKQMRDFWFWSHLLLAWPLPVLLSFHVLSVYYF
ncbi:MAG: FAD-dependent oxidoreductase, partial [Motiliproteus sp.]|nr:FAD-dependent oxidoreductase [Motiliproteus sp.]